MRRVMLGASLVVLVGCSDGLVQPDPGGQGSFAVIPAAEQAVVDACNATRSLPNHNWTYETVAIPREATYSLEHPWPGRHDGDVHAEQYETLEAPRYTCVPTNRGGNTSLEDHPNFEVVVGEIETGLFAADLKVCEADLSGGSHATPANDGSIACPFAFGPLFPAVSDFAEAGPYPTVSVIVASVGCTIFRPATLRTDGGKHPIIIWGNGTGATPASYSGLLHHLASHGFVVGAANTTNAGTGVDMLACLDFLEEQNDLGGAYERQLNIYRVGTSGHSQGGGGSIMAGRDARIGATAPMQPYVLGLGYQPGAASQQHGRMFLMSGSLDFIAGPTFNQGPVYNSANVPVFWAIRVGANHFEPVGSAGAFRGPTTAWFRYHFMLDPTARPLFYGQNCGLCTAPLWNIQRKGDFS